MLDELKSLEYKGRKEELLFFLCDVIGNQSIRISDAEAICNHAAGNRHLIADDLIQYCRAFRWIQLHSNRVVNSSSLTPFLNDKDKLNDILVSSTVNRLFSEQVLNADMFYFDSMQYRCVFRNELLPLSFSSIRNTLINQGFFIVQRDAQGVRFYVSNRYEVFLAKLCKKARNKMTLEQLKRKIEENELAGETAELYVLEYEKKRLGFPLCERVQRISDIDVSAGYDIVSFDTPQSSEADRFIEVKAVSDNGFYWTRNEYEIAKLKGERYYLYLIDLCKIEDSAYSPKIVQHPSMNIIHSDNWFIETQSFFIRPV